MVQTNGYKACSLCYHDSSAEVSHPIFKCSKFPTADAKLTELRRLNACVKCADLGHTSESCRYRFKNKCRHCSGWHFNFLCSAFNSKISNVRKASDVVPKLQSTQGLKGKDAKASSNVSTASTDALQSSVDSESILPTFTCLVDGKRKIRGLKDGGCQSNFITTDLADQLKLKVIKEGVSLTVNGINSSRDYSTKLVEMKVHFGTKECVLEALCLPIIHISLNLPGLSHIAHSFVKQGHLLADDFLLSGSNCIAGVQFILGTKSGHCLPESEVVFGAEGSSLFSRTPHGIMLKGDVRQIMRDLPCLPHSDSVSTAPSFDTSFIAFNEKS